MTVFHLFPDLFLSKLSLFCLEFSVGCKFSSKQNRWTVRCPVTSSNWKQILTCVENQLQGGGPKLDWRRQLKLIRLSTHNGVQKYSKGSSQTTSLWNQLSLPNQNQNWNIFWHLHSTCDDKETWFRKGLFKQDAEHLAEGTMQTVEHIVANGSVHTASKQNQRICMQTCVRVLGELGLRSLCFQLCGLKITHTHTHTRARAPPKHCE